MPGDSAVKTELLTEAHSSPFTMYPGSTKMYQDLRCVYWWRNMKREVADFVSRCLVCQQVKAPRQRPAGLTKSAHFVPGKSTYTASKWGQLYMTEIVRLHGVPVSIVSDRDARFTSKFWKGLQLALGTRLDFSTTFHPQTDRQTEREIGERRLLGPELVQTTNAAIQMIRARMLTAQSRQKSYVDVRCKDLEFDVGDMVFLKVAPMKVVLFLHDVFHVSMLRKYVRDPMHVVDFEPLQLSENLSYEEQPIEILAREVKRLRNRGIALVKVLWRNHGVKEATWESEENMRAQYLELFEN
ncbi:putative polyprotein [Cucumis melo var. makuwa]|uniref:Polyprotein n=1 Tax=Cucumis melo var. makuwa TaxID=1194695 RepID=A0A5A7V3S6_CUCMM|nr:putative polyprotein [Cucumis melo var. makuwa]TYK22120.1 putative polyprotein [Cucumis melo var. makuwa]